MRKNKGWGMKCVQGIEKHLQDTGTSVWWMVKCAQ